MSALATIQRPSTPIGQRASSQPDRRTQGFDVIRWMEACLVHTEGEWRGKPFRLMAWQKRLLLELFTLEEDPEWVPTTREARRFRAGLRRRHRQAFICLPKKQGKTELAAAIALYLMIGDAEPSPKGVFAAGSLHQAGLSFRAAQTMILESPILRQLAGDRNVGDLVIEIPSIPGSRLERIAAEAGTNDGPSLHFGVLDEVHEWSGEQGRKVHGVITNAGAARKNPLFVSISTVGVDEQDDDQVWVDLYRRGLAAQANPSADPTFYFHLVQAPAGADWQNRLVWEAANPSANETVSWSFYQSEWAKGESWCRRYYLNQPTGRVEDPWMPPDLWDARAGDVAFTTDVPTYATVRIAHDHRSAAVALAQRQGDRVAVMARAFPDEPLPEGEFVEADELENHVRLLHRLYPARVMAVTKAHSRGRERLMPAQGPEVSYHGSFFESSAQRLRRDGIVMVDVPHSQERLAPAAETLMQLATSGQLVHDGDPQLAHQIDNVVAKQSDRGWRIQAPTGSRKRTEAALATMAAVHRALTAPPPPSRVMHFGGRPR